MSTITTAPGLIALDPIQGLVDYVTEIKPFHTKIFEVLFEYVYTDNVATTVRDTLVWNINSNPTYFTSTIDPALVNEGGISSNSHWYNPTNNTLYLRGNYYNPYILAGTNQIIIPGNLTNLFVSGFALNITGTGTIDDGAYTVTTSVFDGTYTTLTLASTYGGITTALIANPGSNYTTGVHFVSLLGGSGTGATALVTATGSFPSFHGPIISIVILNPGVGYKDGDVLTATIPGGSGFQATVTGVRISFVTPPIVPIVADTLYWDGTNLYIIDGTNSTLIPNVLVSTTTPAYGVQISNPVNYPPIAYWYNPNTPNQLYYWNATSNAYVPATLYAGSVGYWITAQTQLTANPSPGMIETTATEFVETISFQWGGDEVYTIVSSNLVSNQVTIAGNISTEVKVNDITEVNGVFSSIAEVVYDPTTGNTLITLATLPSSGPTLTVENIDITYWYQFSIVSANPTPTLPSQSSNVQNQGNPSDLASPRSITNNTILSISGGAGTQVPSITLLGNATTSIQVGSIFKIDGSVSNDGAYTAIYVQYEPISNLTTVGVQPALNSPGSAIVSASGGGIAIPYRFIAETAAGTFDTTGYDTGPYDQSGGSIVYQGP